jgi:hypothetical protein
MKLGVGTGLFAHFGGLMYFIDANDPQVQAGAIVAAAQIAAKHFAATEVSAEKVIVIARALLEEIDKDPGNPAAKKAAG